ncbi:MAG: ATP-binding protein [Flavobacteriaceae bacterium]|nr:ATP-binding protein [Flavobacteriaceae bacterium]
MNPKNQKIVIIGAPGSGKTSVIEMLIQKGYDCFPEISREVTLEARKEGIDQLFLHDPILFSTKLIAGRLKQYEDAKSKNLVFFDRGLPDVVAYHHYLKTDYPPSFDTICQENPYDVVFVLPPWKAIYTSDSVRYESFEQAKKIHENLMQTYQRFSMTPQPVPFGEVVERVAFIEQQLA